MNLVTVVMEHPMTFGIVAAALLLCLLMGQKIKNVPLMEECNGCGAILTKKEVTLTEKRFLCSKCRTAHCDNKTEENYRRAKAKLNYH